MTERKIQSPCYGCESRHMRCHTECEKYAEFAEKAEKLREERHALSDSYRAINDVKRKFRSEYKRRKDDEK